MISHEYKCIFIHIQRTGGTSIEKAIQGEDQFDKLHRTKHILASTAKEIYKDYWDDYFKFSIVRNPWDRMVSFASMGWLDTRIVDGKVNVDSFLSYITNNKYEVPVFSESVSRLHTYDNYIENSVYCNILNEDLDFIGRFENLHEDFATICEKIGCKNELPSDHKNVSENYKGFYNEHSKQVVQNIYKEDLKRFNYTF